MKSCPVCSGTDLEDLADLARCRACGHLFQYPPRITALYDAAYVRRYDQHPTREMSYLRLGFLKAFVSGGRLLDVGYGKGDFVRAAMAAGFEAFGFEVHGLAYNVHEVDIATDESRWDVVTFFDSLEHFTDFAVLRPLFARARYVLVSLPWAPPTFPADRRWKHYKPGEHLHYFTAASLAKLIAKPLRWASDVEDAIRGAGPSGQNICTAFFG